MFLCHEFEYSDELVSFMLYVLEYLRIEAKHFLSMGRVCNYLRVGEDIFVHSIELLFPSHIYLETCPPPTLWQISKITEEISRINLYNKLN